MSRSPNTAGPTDSRANREVVLPVFALSGAFVMVLLGMLIPGFRRPATAAAASYGSAAEARA